MVAGGGTLGSGEVFVEKMIPWMLASRGE